ncbi:MAG: aldehyde ferredoxin oxidoreductase family protein [Asgard group archaeon]|nr:aldehyde ferredoxin oxidoreductase family protein [Asgard group archaeon]
MMSGFRGKILRVNLTNMAVKEEKLDLEAAQEFLGGSGLAAHYYWRHIMDYAEIPEPLSADNPLIFMTGALTGLPSYCTARTNFCSRSPLTTFFGDANIGGKIGPKLKFAGYDGIIIEGKSDKPVFISINDSNVEIRNAEELWGKGTYDTLEMVREELGNKKAEVVCIGPAGENFVKYSCIMTHGGRAAGRTGMGAVMGSKNLKAIAVHGTNREFDLPEEFMLLSKDAYNSVKEDYTVEIFSEFGTSGYLDVALEHYGDIPIRNWSKGTLENGTNLSGITMSETILIGKSTCYRCPIACGREIEITKGKYKTDKTDGPEFETLASMGTNLEITDLEAIVFANIKANDYGIDTISVGATIGVYYDLIEKGAIPIKKHPRDIKSEFGDADSLLRLLELISKRQGIGDDLAEGSKILAQKYSHPELAPQVAGLEAPTHDPRAFSGLAVMYVTSPRGACHLNGDAYYVQQGLIFPDLGIDNLPNDRFDNVGVVQPLVYLQSYRQVYNSAGVCQFYNPSGSKLARLISIAISRKTSTKELLKTGDRIFGLKRIINMKLGWTPSLEFLPKVMLQKLEGPTEGRIPDVKIQLDLWYKYRKYNRKTGIPSKSELKRLNLEKYL